MVTVAIGSRVVIWLGKVIRPVIALIIAERVLLWSSTGVVKWYC